MKNLTHNGFISFFIIMSWNKANAIMILKNKRTNCNHN